LMRSVSVRAESLSPRDIIILSEKLDSRKKRMLLRISLLSGSISSISLPKEIKKIPVTEAAITIRKAIEINTFVRTFAFA
ncbi:MAG: hypothetical protein KKF00_14110, partial [Proteobacteria bacterium]|nr:hypothetical protein [Pseudomonadota bacterium]